MCYIYQQAWCNAFTSTGPGTFSTAGRVLGLGGLPSAIAVPLPAGKQKKKHHQPGFKIPEWNFRNFGPIGNHPLPRYNIISADFFLIFHEFWQYLFKFNWILFKFSELNFVLSATLSATPIQISKKKDWTLSSSAHHHRAVFPSFPCE